jgi:hypothetical protein
MKPLKSLPAGYLHHVTLDLSKKKLILILNGIALLLVLLYYLLYLFIVRRFNPGADLSISINFNSGFLAFVIFIVMTVFVIILHEFIHGIFYWLYTHERPVFAIKSAYAYASAPNWYLPRNQFIIVGLAPLMFISVFPLILLPYLTSPFVHIIMLEMSINAAGSLGDMIVIAKMLTLPASAMVNDHGDLIVVYLP